MFSESTDVSMAAGMVTKAQAENREPQVRKCLPYVGSGLKSLH